MKAEDALILPSPSAQIRPTIVTSSGDAAKTGANGGSSREPASTALVSSASRAATCSSNRRARSSIFSHMYDGPGLAGPSPRYVTAAAADAVETPGRMPRAAPSSPCSVAITLPESVREAKVVPGEPPVAGVVGIVRRPGTRPPGVDCDGAAPSAPLWSRCAESLVNVLGGGARVVCCAFVSFASCRAFFFACDAFTCPSRSASASSESARDVAALSSTMSHSADSSSAVTRNVSQSRASPLSTAGSRTPSNSASISARVVMAARAIFSRRRRCAEAEEPAKAAATISAARAHAAAGWR